MFDGNVCYIFSSDFFHSGLNVNFLKQMYGNKQIPLTFFCVSYVTYAFFRKDYKIQF